MADPRAHIVVHALTLAYGDRVVLTDLDFSVKRGQVFIVMGPSGCVNFTRAAAGEREAILRRVGVLYQSGALWSSMTLAENVGFPLQEYTDLTRDEIRDVASLKLALVGLEGFEDYYPAEI